ncbi:MAG: hypothetical protein U0841_24225 [Chloroflexia bacterium]
MGAAGCEHARSGKENGEGCPSLSLFFWEVLPGVLAADGNLQRGAAEIGQRERAQGVRGGEQLLDQGNEALGQY